MTYFNKIILEWKTRQIMNGKIVEIIKESLANSWKKKGCYFYRSLLVDDSKESEEAIKLMETLGVAYKLQYLGDIRNSEEVKLPTLSLSYGKKFQGLEEIKYYGEIAFGKRCEEVLNKEQNGNKSKIMDRYPLSQTTSDRGN